MLSSTHGCDYQTYLDGPTAANKQRDANYVTDSRYGVHRECATSIRIPNSKVSIGILHNVSARQLRERLKELT